MSNKSNTKRDDVASRRKLSDMFGGSTLQDISNKDKISCKDDTCDKEATVLTSVMLPISLLNEVRSISYWDRTLIKDIVISALIDYVAKYKDDHDGVIEEVPEDVKSKWSTPKNKRNSK